MGDILFGYAVIGMLAYLFRKRQPRTLIIVACFLMPVTPLMNYGMHFFMIEMQTQAQETTDLQTAGETLATEQEKILSEWEDTRAMMAPTPDDVQKDVDAYLGSYLGIVKYRAPVVLELQFFMVIFWGLWRVGGLMLIGMGLMKWGVLTGRRSASFYRKFMLSGYLLGLPLTVFSAYDLYQHQFDGLYTMRLGGIANYVGSVPVALGHVGLVMLVVKTGAMRRLMARFAAVGRMALTNYLLHSLVLTSVFYGYGLGLYGQVPRMAQMLFVIAVVALQLVLSPWWLSRFRFGPVEWLWRSLTYSQRQPMRATG